MKKKAFAFLFSLFAFGTVFAMSKNKAVSIVGYVHFYGNEPFSFTGFESVDGQVYALEVEDGADFTISDIGRQSGNLLELTGTVKKDTAVEEAYGILENGCFVIMNYKILAQN